MTNKVIIKSTSNVSLKKKRYFYVTACLTVLNIFSSCYKTSSAALVLRRKNEGVDILKLAK